MKQHFYEIAQCQLPYAFFLESDVHKITWSKYNAEIILLLKNIV